MAQDGSKIGPDSPQIAFKMIKNHLENQYFCSWTASWPQESPRWPQDGPRWPQDGPRWPQDGPRWPKMVPGWPKMAPRWPQDGPKRGPQRVPNRSYKGFQHRS